MALLLPPAQQFLDLNGNPLSGGSITFYSSGTTTLKTVYSDAALTVALANPYPLDAAGRLEGSVNAYSGDGERYTIEVKDATGATSWTRNDVWGSRELELGSAGPYTSSSSGAIERTIAQKLDDTVTVKDFGATGDGTTNDTAAVQACIDYMVANGGTVKFPAGNYRIEEQLLIDESTVTDETDITRVSLEGDGMGNTRLRFVGTTQATSGIKYLGASLEAYIEIASLRLEGVGVADTRGLWLDDVAFASIRDVIVTAFGDHGIYATDILSVAMDHVLVRGNKYGMYASNGDGSHPNAITMTACDFANTEYGIDLVNPANFSMFGGSIQGNGRNGTGASSDRFGIRMVDGAQQGAAACLLSGVYFELNVGDADILIDQTADGHECIYTVNGCSFNRIHVTDFVTNNIKVNASSGKCHLHTNGNGFRGFNDYVEVTGRKYIAFSNSGANELVWHGAFENMYEALDANPTINAISGPGAVSPLFPMTHITTTGADAYTLPNGAEGQEIEVVMIVDGGAGTLTPTSLAGSATTITFDDGGDTAQLRFTNGAWYMTGGTATLA